MPFDLCIRKGFRFGFKLMENCLQKAIADKHSLWQPLATRI